MKKTSITKALKIEGMTCAGCELKLENGVKKVKGVSKAKASLADGKLHVTFDVDETGLPEIAKAVEQMGYRAVESQNTPEHKTRQAGKIKGEGGGQLFGFGALSSIMSKKFTRTLMKSSAVLVMVLGAVMLGRGLSLSGIALPDTDTGVLQYAHVEGNVQTVAIDVRSDQYAPIVVQKGIPVKFIMKAEAENLAGCNRTVVIPSYNIKKTLEPGETIIEFTPRVTGKVSYTCSMGMIKSSITVVEDITVSKAGGTGK